MCNLLASIYAWPKLSSQAESKLSIDEDLANSIWWCCCLKMSHVIERHYRSSIPDESWSGTTPVILMARLLFHVTGINSQHGCTAQNRRVLWHFLYYVNNDRQCGGDRGVHAFITVCEVYAERTGQGVSLGDRHLHSAFCCSSADSDRSI